MYRSSLILLALLGTRAYGQPVDDPGIASLKHEQAAPAGEVRETIDTKESWVDPPRGEVYERVTSSTVVGPIGLLHTITGETGRPNTFRVGLHFGGFQQNNLVIGPSSTALGDSNGQFTANLTIDYTTPWKYLEAYLGLFSRTNQNTREDPGRSDPATILAIGDLQFGLKGHLPVKPYLDLALHLGVKLIDSVSGAGFDADSTNVAVDGVASFDLRRTAAHAPLRFHVNFGYLHDNSMSLLPVGQCASSMNNDSCIRSRAVETFAYGIGTSRVRLGLAADLPLVVRSVGIQPMVEYHLDGATADGDPTLVKALTATLGADRLSNRVAQFLTVGVRARPVAGLVADLGIDIGLQSAGFQFGAPLPAWNLMAGLQYAYDPHAKVRSVTKTVTREVVAPKVAGRVRGVVRDAETKKPIPDALVKYVDRRATPQGSADDGTFVSYELRPGPLRLEVSRDDYDAKMVETSAPEKGELPIEVLLTRKPPAAGLVRGHVSDPAGMPVMATVRLVSSTGTLVEAEVPSVGSFIAKLASGDYVMDVLADGFLAKQRTVSVISGQLENLDLTLARHPAVSHVALAPDEIQLKGTLHFASNNVELRPDSQQLLDEVVDLLTRNPQIRKVRIEGHTDSRGDAARNLELSRQRAQTVAGYLVKQGIDPSRVLADGLGSTQPLLPNLTAMSRAKNRRVAFKIVDPAP